MNTSQKDLVSVIGSRLNIPDLINFCLINKTIASVCQNDKFWPLYVRTQLKHIFRQYFFGISDNSVNTLIVKYSIPTLIKIIKSTSTYMPMININIISEDDGMYVYLKFNDDENQLTFKLKKHNETNLSLTIITDIYNQLDIQPIDDIIKQKTGLHATIYQLHQPTGWFLYFTHISLIVPLVLGDELIATIMAHMILKYGAYINKVSRKDEN